MILIGRVQRTRIYGHDQQHIGRGSDFICDSRRWRIRGNCNTGLHVAFMNSTDEGHSIRFGVLEMHGKREKRRPTSCFDVEAVQRPPCIGNVIDPLGYRGVTDLQREERGCTITFSGCATIM